MFEDLYYVCINRRWDSQWSAKFGEVSALSVAVDKRPASQRYAHTSSQMPGSLCADLQ